MIKIDKLEAEKIREKYPDVSLVRTMKDQSSRHRYYCPESDKYLEVIQDTNSEAKEILAQHKNKHLKIYQN